MTVTETTRSTEPSTELPNAWRWVRLGDICDMNPSRPAGFRRASDTLTAFVPMSVVDEHRGVILNVERRPFREVAKGYTFFGEGDILFAKITPCMQNGKQVIARGLIDGIGFGSTEFHVIRPRRGVTSEWIHRFVRQPHVLSAAANHFTGAVGQQRVPESFLASLKIPLPSIDEQDRIMHIVNEQMTAVEKARGAAEARLEAAKALPAAYLRAAFNSEEVQTWPSQRLSDVCEITAKQVDPKIPDFAALPHVNGENIETGTCRITYLKTAGELGMISGKYLFEPGDVLYSKLRPYLRKVTVVDFKGVCSADMYPITVNKDRLAPHFLAWILVSDDFTNYADNESRRARMPKLNRDQLLSWNIPLPPVSIQFAIVNRLSSELTRIESLVMIIKQELETINALTAALLRMAFTGGL